MKDLLKVTDQSKLKDFGFDSFEKLFFQVYGQGRTFLIKTLPSKSKETNILLAVDPDNGELLLLDLNDPEYPLKLDDVIKLYKAGVVEEVT